MKEINKVNVKRNNPPEKRDPPPEPPSVSAGPVDKIVELVFNPTHDKIKEMTIIDRMQGRLLPQLDVLSAEWGACIELAEFREDSEQYAVDHGRPCPVPFNSIELFTYSTAQWQKSIAGKNLERATDIALAETETKVDMDDGFSNVDPFKD